MIDDSEILRERGAGILLHPTSLPGRGIGTLGDAAYRFVDWLVGAGQSYWQILPLVAVDQGGSPYCGLSAMAGNPLLVDLDELVRAGLLREADLAGAPARGEPVDFPAVTRWKEGLLFRAYEAFRDGAAPQLGAPFQRYRAEQSRWLDDFALFRALRRYHHGAPWTDWAPELRGRDAAALAEWGERLSDEVEAQRFEQFLFDRQWRALREYANERGVKIIGDIPIFVAHDSADVWAHPDMFLLDEGGQPLVVAGVPPDYFSATGQRWGNPLYDWDLLRERDYDWWVERFHRTLEWVDLVRVDHFRGFEAYWEVPAAEETAMRGQWRPGPGAELFRAVQRRLGRLPVIAEDLGIITPEVEALRDTLGFPGMRVLHFAFDGDPENPYLPENYQANAVAYTGTHDNDTTVGWWRSASEAEREQVALRLEESEQQIHWALIEMVFRSRARLAVVPLQDVLGLGSEARMNTPGTVAANWAWRLPQDALSAAAQARLREATRRGERLPNRPPA